MDETVRIPCPFCDRAHSGEFWDEVEAEVMACRDKATGRKRGDLEAFSEEELDGRPILGQVPYG